MKLLDALKSQSSGPHRVIDAVAQGDHGISSRPPLEDLRRLAEAWLNDVMSCEPEPIVAHLQVEQRRDKTARSFYGVKSLWIPDYNPVAVELRIRPQKSTYQWICHIVFDSGDTAHTVAHIARPNAAGYIASHQDVEAKPKKGAHTHAVKQQLSEDQKLLERYRRNLQRRATQVEFCAYLASINNGRSIPENMIKSGLGRVLKADSLLAIHSSALLATLVDQGFLDPNDEKGSTFDISVRGEEFAEDHARQQKEERLAALRRELEKLDRIKASAGKERVRLQDRLKEIDVQERAISDQLRSVREQITELQ